MIRLSCSNLLTASPNFDILVKIFTCSSSPSPLAKSWLRAKPYPQLTFHSLSRKNSLFSKISDDIIACNLRFAPPHPIQKPGYAYAINRVQCAYQITVVASLYCHALFTSGCLQHSKGAKYTLHCFQSKSSLVWKYGMEYGRKL